MEFRSRNIVVDDDDAFLASLRSYSRTKGSDRSSSAASGPKRSSRRRRAESLSDRPPWRGPIDERPAGYGFDERNFDAPEFELPDRLVINRLNGYSRHHADDVVMAEGESAISMLFIFKFCVEWNYCTVNIIKYLL